MIPALLFASAATIGSSVNLTRISVSTHTPTAPRSLSERAVLEGLLLQRFRNTLLICSTFFAISIYVFIAPHTRHGWFIASSWTIAYLGVIFAALLPAHGKTFRAHTVAAQGMGVGMLLLAYVYSQSFTGLSGGVELAFSILMTIFALLTYLDKSRYIFHELGFLYLNHLTIVVAALSLK